MATLKLYLTSLEPGLNQTIYSQSLGGYVSNSLVYPETTLSVTLGLYDTNLTLNTPVSGSWSEWQGIEYINIGNELIKVTPIVNGTITITQRAYNNIYNTHLAGDVVTACSSKELFNDVFNDNYKQYRCIAIKNISTNLTDPSSEQIAYDLVVYIKQNSRNINSSIKIALERPTSEYVSGTSTSWSAMQLIDTSLIDIYGDDYFKESYLSIISGDASGQGKIISSFDSSTGTFTFYNSFSSTYDFSKNIIYEIAPSPAQRIKTGTISPNIGSSNVTQFFNSNQNTPLTFYEQASVFNINNLSPNDVMYLWIERMVEKGSSEFLNNDFVINIRYKVSE